MHINKINNILSALRINYELKLKRELNTYYLYQYNIYSNMNELVKKVLFNELKKSFCNTYSYIEFDPDYDKFYIEITKDNPKSIHLIDYLKNFTIIQSVRYIPFGINSFNVVKQRFSDLFVFAHILGDDNSGKYEYLHSLLCYLALIEKKENLFIDIVDLKNKFTKFINLPHLRNYITKQEQTNTLLKDLYQECLYRLELFKENNLSNFNMYNQHNPNDQLKRIYVIIDDYNLIPESELKNEFFKLFDEGQITGIYIYLSLEKAKENDTFSFSRISFKTSLEDSNNFLGNNYASMLAGNGDFVYHDPIGQERFQAPFIDDDTIANTIKRITVFKDE